MRLFIAEKPSAAKSLAAVIGATLRGEGYYFDNRGHMVTWCVGHLFEFAQPEDYDAKLKQWRMEDLPIAPTRWKVLPKDSMKKQIKAIGALLADATEVVNAGDPDNEGQLLVDEVLEHFKCRKPTLRYWSSAMDEQSVRNALNSMRDNRDFAGMRDAARARQRADWLIGMNFSRAFTLQLRAAGGDGVISVGRVQTPTLAMVAARDEAIAAFKPRPFHVLVGRVSHGASSFFMRWNPGDGQAGLDEEGRLVDTAEADRLVASLSGQQGRITLFSKTRKREEHPKGLSLTHLTLLASKAFGYGASDVLEICQALYETHKVATYPRTDCEYLPESQHAAAPQVLAAVAANLPDVAGWVKMADPATRSRIWDDSKVTAHHGIIPTVQRCDMRALKPAELDVYQLIVRGYVAQFFPLHEYLQTAVEAGVGGECFAAKGRTVLVGGWKDLYQAPAEEGDEDEDQALPVMAEGDAVTLDQLERRDQVTKPPVRFTEATLVVAMENVHKYIDDPADKKALKDGEGIGTPATRAGIISELKRRGFLVNEKKYIVSTPAGRAALAALPAALKSPALTALYQRQLQDVERGALNLDRFVDEQLRFVAEQVGSVRQATPAPKVIHCPMCDAGRLRRIARKDGSGHFWSCSEWRNGCQCTANDNAGEPDLSWTQRI